MTITKLATYIPGFDQLAQGGLPQGRSTLLSGAAGSAKTVFATQFLAAGIRVADEAAVFVTFEESPADIRQNMLGFGWLIANWEAEGKWAFVDASPDPGEQAVVTGQFDLGALLARIESAIKRVNAKRVVLDSLGSIFMQFNDPLLVRRELMRIGHELKRLGVTSLITAERVYEDGSLSRYGVEEFVADNVVIVRNELSAEKRRRTIEILKFRGTMHQKGQFPFTLRSQDGVVVIPLSVIELTQGSSTTRMPSGNAELDVMCGGGFFRDSIILVSGPTGTGKTLMSTLFLNGGLAAGEKCLLFAFEESREQLFRNAAGWGVDFAKYEKTGQLKVLCAYPESDSLEDHLLKIRDEIDSFKPQRLAIDSLSALERVSSETNFREFVIGLTSHLKKLGVAGLITSTTPNLLGGSSITESHISTITDSIVLLRYVEMYGEMRRGVTVLKMRGSQHDKTIREFSIDGHGMSIGRPFRNVFGILSGNFSHLPPEQVERFEKQTEAPLAAPAVPGS